MDCEESNKELWGWQEEEYCLQKDTRSDISHCLWDEVNHNEDDLLYMLDEHTPVKDCADFGYLISDIGDKANNGEEESTESSQMKRRRTLQFNCDDTDSINNELSSTFVKSKIREDLLLEDELNNANMQWVSGSLDNQEGLDQSSECWLASCFNENEMQLSSDEMNASGASEDPTDISDHYDVAPAPQKEAVRVPVIVSTTHSSKFKGRKSFIRTPTKMTSSVAYPFALIKPCGVQGDVTLKDINQRIHAPLLSKSKHTENDDSLHCYPTSAFSGKPVVVKTKIRTEGGKGSITIMRTKG
uniref:Protein XRI1 n=1 Tax=Anthurium amnicola TaxID=1678845 RepID=A0A1D1XE81_9ARAE